MFSLEMNQNYNFIVLLNLKYFRVMPMKLEKCKWIGYLVMMTFQHIFHLLKGCGKMQEYRNATTEEENINSLIPQISKK